MSDTPNLKLPYIVAAQAQKHVTHNEAIRALDALIQLAVLDRNLAIPPGSPTEGDRYIVAPSATGAWAGHDGEISAFQDGAWMFHTPNEGWICWIADENVSVVFDGTAWISFASGGGGSSTFTGLSDTPATMTGAANKIAAVNTAETALEFVIELPLLGINATPDATNKLSVSSSASLLNHAGAGHQAKVNKNASTDTASFLFQTAFSGRAEMGTTGDDDFHFKVSPNGSTWIEALNFDKSTGDASFPQNAAFSGYMDVSEIATPANPATDTARLFAKDDSGTTKLAMRDSAGTQTVFAPEPEVLIAADEKANGTAGGTFTSGAWRTRDINTLRKNNISSASLASNQITLPAGDYLIEATAPVNGVAKHQTRIYDTTNSAVLAVGFNGDSSWPSHVVGHFTLAASAAIELQHICQTTASTNGFGIDNTITGNSDVAVFSQISVRKI